MDRRDITGVAVRRHAAGIGDAATGTAAGTTIDLLKSLVEDPSYIESGHSHNQDDNQCLHVSRPLSQSVSKRGPGLVDDYRQRKSQTRVKQHGK